MEGALDSKAGDEARRKKNIPHSKAYEISDL
jgi:hypothetical protein